MLCAVVLCAGRDLKSSGASRELEFAARSNCIDLGVLFVGKKKPQSLPLTCAWSGYRRALNYDQAVSNKRPKNLESVRKQESVFENVPKERPLFLEAMLRIFDV